MNFSSFFLVISLAGIVFIVGIYLIKKSHRDTQKKRVMRQVLLMRIEKLRLPRMLQALGINLTNYLYTVPVDQIDQCATNCEQCESTDLCDEKLKIPELNPGDIDFCASQQHLSQYSREKRIKGY